jgi:hypothetical protein
MAGYVEVAFRSSSPGQEHQPGFYYGPEDEEGHVMEFTVRFPFEAAPADAEVDEKIQLYLRNQRYEEDKDGAVHRSISVLMVGSFQLAQSD